MKKFTIIIIFIVLFSTIAGCISYIDDDNQDEIKIDTDKDGIYDDNDDFPTDPAASKDTDKDGYPDEWNKNKNQSDSTTNLTLDDFRYDPAASKDTDKDGYPDNWNTDKSQIDSSSIPPLEIDEFPFDEKAHKDTDKDGYADYYDINDNVNLSIDININDFKITNKVDILRWAQIYLELYVDDKFEKIDNNGRKWWVLLNKKQNIDYHFHYDIPDDTVDKFTNVKIVMYDFDLLKTDDIVDISDGLGGDNTNLSVLFDNEKNLPNTNSVSSGSQGILWYDISFETDEITEIETYKRAYNWKFDDKQWNLPLEIPKELYNYYQNDSINRIPQNQNIDIEKKMALFVTSNDDTIEEIADSLQKIADEQGYDRYETANFILKFVQENIAYSFDNETKGCVEYWRYPVETLVDKKGDCEDTSVLYAAIMENLGFQTVLLYYTWIEDNGDAVGHLATGVHLRGNHGDFVVGDNALKYYYCETTHKIFNVGELPDSPKQIKEGPTLIIYL